MKGISLSIETIIVIILAVSVMTALLMFFNSQWNPFVGQIDYRNVQREQCYTLVSSNGFKCSASGVDSKVMDKVKDLGKACQYLKYASCSGSLSDECLKQCCSMFCTGK
jgi:hypothetical protein